MKRPATLVKTVRQDINWHEAWYEVHPPITWFEAVLPFVHVFTMWRPSETQTLVTAMEGINKWNGPSHCIFESEEAISHVTALARIGLEVRHAESHPNRHLSSEHDES